MAVIRLQNSYGDNHVHYEFDPTQKSLGEGGMGRVFRGVQVDENNGARRTREVAIKLMFDDLPEHAIKRAQREAKIRIKNDNLVEMIDFVEDRDETTHSVHYHVISEFLNGVNLDEMLEGKLTNHDGSQNPTAERLFNTYNNHRKAFVGEVFRSILSGIMALHDAGYIHRDIDPSNIMVTSEGKIKLIDFGIAKKVGELGTNDKQLTSAGQFVGKTHYAAPELLLGDLNNQNCTTDIYSLGITLFQLITGHLPFDGTFQEVYEKQLREKLPLREVEDRTVRGIIEKATEKDQKKRYQSASEFRVDIDKWMAENPTPNPLPNRITLFAASVAVLVVAVCIIVKTMKKDDSNTSKGGNTSEIVQVTPSNPKSEKVLPILTDSGTDYELVLASTDNPADEFRWIKERADEGDYEAAFLVSRLYFDPSSVAKEGTEFYQTKWESMRGKCGIMADNTAAHNYLMKAWRTDKGKNDPALLYELGCDFLYGRGVDKNFGKAHTCFEQVDMMTSSSSPYKEAVKDKLARAKQKPAEPIEPLYINREE